jgi:hypothetical protein
MDAPSIFGDSSKGSVFVSANEARQLVHTYTHESDGVRLDVARAHAFFKSVNNAKKSLESQVKQLEEEGKETKQRVIDVKKTQNIEAKKNTLEDKKKAIRDARAEVDKIPTGSDAKNEETVRKAYVDLDTAKREAVTAAADFRDAKRVIDSVERDVERATKNLDNVKGALTAIIRVSVLIDAREAEDQKVQTEAERELRREARFESMTPREVYEMRNGDHLPFALVRFGGTARAKTEAEFLRAATAELLAYANRVPSQGIRSFVVDLKTRLKRGNPVEIKAEQSQWHIDQYGTYDATLEADGAKRMVTTTLQHAMPGPPAVPDPYLPSFATKIPMSNPAVWSKTEAYEDGTGFELKQLWDDLLGAQPTNGGADEAMVLVAAFEKARTAWQLFGAFARSANAEAYTGDINADYASGKLEKEEKKEKKK